MLFEVEAFNANDISRIGNGTFSAHGIEFDTREAFYLPLAPEDWGRLKSYWSGLQDSEGNLTDYWRTRKSNFLYVYSKSQETVLISGYFQSGYVGQFINGPAQKFNMPFQNERQRELFLKFGNEVGPYIRSWYPLLPSLVDFYDLHKNHNIAGAINRHAQRPDGLRVLEIGAGGCLLPLMLRKMTEISTYTVIDLPFVIPFGFCMSRSFAPEMTVALPNEKAADAVLTFQTNADYEIEPAAYDAAVNVTSFGEMSGEAVEEYFDLIGRGLKPGGVFVCVNRKEKTTSFEEYPWAKLGGEVLVDEPDLVSQYHNQDWPVLRRIIRRK